MEWDDQNQYEMEAAAEYERQLGLTADGDEGVGSEVEEEIYSHLYFTHSEVPVRSEPTTPVKTRANDKKDSSLLKDALISSSTKKEKEKEEPRGSESGDSKEKKKKEKKEKKEKKDKKKKDDQDDKKDKKDKKDRKDKKEKKEKKDKKKNQTGSESETGQEEHGNGSVRTNNSDEEEEMSKSAIFGKGKKATKKSTKSKKAESSSDDEEEEEKHEWFRESEDEKDGEDEEFIGLGTNSQGEDSFRLNMIDEDDSENERYAIRVLGLERVETQDSVELDLPSDVKKATRYYVEKGKCRNCGVGGHFAFECSAPKKERVCYLCAKTGHNAYECPAEYCFNCLTLGHHSKSCPKPRKHRFTLYCSTCRVTGHDDKRCHNVWRVYQMEKNVPGELSTVSCYNCASSGHFGDDCPTVEKRGSATASPFRGGGGKYSGRAEYLSTKKLAYKRKHFESSGDEQLTERESRKILKREGKEKLQKKKRRERQKKNKKQKEEEKNREKKRKRAEETGEPEKKKKKRKTESSA